MHEDKVQDNRIDALVAKATGAGFLAKKEIEGAFGPKEGDKVLETLETWARWTSRSSRRRTW